MAWKMIRQVDGHPVAGVLHGTTRKIYILNLEIT